MTRITLITLLSTTPFLVGLWGTLAFVAAGGLAILAVRCWLTEPPERSTVSEYLPIRDRRGGINLDRPGIA